MKHVTDAMGAVNKFVFAVPKPAGVAVTARQTSSRGLFIPCVCGRRNKEMIPRLQIAQSIKPLNNGERTR
jgi:hypothetical protein